MFIAGQRVNQFDHASLMFLDVRQMLVIGRFMEAVGDGGELLGQCADFLDLLCGNGATFPAGELG